MPASKEGRGGQASADIKGQPRKRNQLDKETYIHSTFMTTLFIQFHFTKNGKNMVISEQNWLVWMGFTDFCNTYSSFLKQFLQFCSLYNDLGKE